MLGVMPCSAAEQVDSLCHGLASPQARVKYGSAKQLVRLSEQDPGLLYPRFDFFVHLLEGEARILRWNSSRILGHLARVDRDQRIEKLLDRFLAPITGHELIAAANAIQGAADIALAKPHLADRIAREIVKVSHAHYATPECRNVAAGHAIQSLDRFFEHIQAKDAVLRFVASQLTNRRPATRKKAEKFWEKWAGW
jgi:signal transduction histidine kinase